MITNEIKQKFTAIAYKLEDENLYEDGELAGTQAIIKEALLVYAWEELERQIGQTVSMIEAFAFEKEVLELIQPSLFLDQPNFKTELTHTECYG